ncbi:MAG: bifunctional riboflavin kinase/FAD synthetase [Bdellovibrionales bacterium]
MKIFSSAQSVARDPDLAHKKLHMAVGNFDGLHLGHRRLLQKALQNKRQWGGLLAVYSFNPHPQSFLSPLKKHILLENRETWYYRLREFGVDVLIEENFTKEFSEKSAEHFLQHQWHERLNLQSLVVGEDFRFGYQRQGDIKLLKSWSQQNGIDFSPISPVLINNQRVSTSGIKSLLFEGRPQQISNYLGRPFSIRGVVQPGDQKGRELGYPTMNIIDASAELLKRGVYVTSVRGALDVWEAITNVGVRPTVHNVSPVVVEAHILNKFQDNLYGQTVEIEFLEFLREEKKFSSFEDLKMQISQDVQLAQEFFRSRHRGLKD